MTTIDITFGALVRQARMSQDLTQKQLAKILGKKYSWISQVENQRSKPDLYTVETFAAALNVPVSEIHPGELGEYSMKSKKFSIGPNAKLLLQCCFLAIGIVALGWAVVNITPKAQAVLSENPQVRAQFKKAVTEFPEDGQVRLEKAFQCFASKLSDTHRERFWKYGKNYSNELLRARAQKFKGQASLYFSTFVCGGDWRDFTKKKD